MNEFQILTIKRLAIATIVEFLWLVYLLIIELQAVHQGHSSTISEIFWFVWAEQPWVFLLVIVVILIPACFLAGHFFGQSSGFYDLIRKTGKIQ